MGEYRTVMQKAPQGGFAQSPDQELGNAGSPLLNRAISIKDAVIGGTAAMYGKKVIGTGIKAVVGQLGISEIENVIEDVTRFAGYGALGLVSPLAGGLAITSDIVTNGIERAVNIHQTNLDNERLIEERGTRRDMNAGGYYG